MIDIKGFENYLYEEELSPNTINNYITALKKYSDVYDEITKVNLIQHKKYLIDNFKPKTVNNRITAILCYCKYKEIPIKIQKYYKNFGFKSENIIRNLDFTP
jgi:hypothetical protein